MRRHTLSSQTSRSSLLDAHPSFSGTSRGSRKGDDAYPAEFCEPLGGHGHGMDAVKPMRRELVVHKPATETFGALVCLIDGKTYVAWVPDADENPDSTKTAACRSGVDFGDQILNINGVDVAGMGPSAVQSMLNHGEKITIEVADHPLFTTHILHLGDSTLRDDEDEALPKSHQDRLLGNGSSLDIDSQGYGAASHRRRIHSQSNLALTHHRQSYGTLPNTLGRHASAPLLRLEPLPEPHDVAVVTSSCCWGWLSWEKSNTKGYHVPAQAPPRPTNSRKSSKACRPCPKCCGVDSRPARCVHDHDVDLGFIYFKSQIKHVVPGSVAHRAGLQPGNTIVRVNDQWVLGMSDSEVASTVARSMVGSEVLSLLVCPANKCAKFLYCVKEIIRRRGLTHTKPHVLLTASKVTPMQNCLSEPSCCF